MNCVCCVCMLVTVSRVEKNQVQIDPAGACCACELSSVCELWQEEESKYLVLRVCMVLSLNKFQNSCSTSLTGLLISVLLGCVCLLLPLPIVFQVASAKLLLPQILLAVKHLDCLTPLASLEVCFHIAGKRKFGLPPFLFVA